MPIPRREGGPRVPAVTDYRRLAAGPHRSIVVARPRSGRLHQVRRHLKSISHPLIGDANYGRGDLNRSYRAEFGLGRLALHAAVCEVRHPRSGAALRLSSPLPRDFTDPLRAMGFNEEDWSMEAIEADIGVAWE